MLTAAAAAAAAAACVCPAALCPTLLLRSLLANLQHLRIDVKNSDVPWHLLLLLLLLNSLRRAWLRTHRLWLLLGCAYGS
jgi:hypothetical protein